jgi:hypothetical protein
MRRFILVLRTVWSLLTLKSWLSLLKGFYVCVGVVELRLIEMLHVRKVFQIIFNDCFLMSDFTKLLAVLINHVKSPVKLKQFLMQVNLILASTIMGRGCGRRPLKWLVVHIWVVVWGSRSITLHLLGMVRRELTIVVSRIWLITRDWLIQTLMLAATFIITACNLHRSSVVIGVNLELTPEIRRSIRIRTKALSIHLLVPVLKLSWWHLFRLIKTIVPWRS